VIEKVFAGVALAVCAALLLRMALPERQRVRLDAAWEHALQRSRQLARRVWFWRAHRRRATREAEDAIRRAQHGVKRDGNVIRPDSFKGPRKPH
jgi:predicted phage gp36 major capsid-like protein